MCKFRESETSGPGRRMRVDPRKGCINNTLDHILKRTRVGNCYVNRNQIGTVAGVQPLGGEGLSGPRRSWITSPFQLFTAFHEERPAM